MATTSLARREIDYSGKRFLLVDSVKEMRANLAATMASFGVSKVDYAAKVVEAIGMIARGNYDVIMADYDLGHGYDGLHFLEELKQSNLLKPSAIFIILSGERRLGNVVSAAELAPDAYLLKPFTGQDMKDRLDRAYRKKAEFAVLDHAMAKGDYFKALNECNERIKAGGTLAPDFMKFKANIALQIGDFAMARATCEAARALKDPVWAKMGLAKSLYYLKDYSAAKAILESLLQENQQLMEAYDWIARIMIAEHQLGDAEAILKQAADKSAGNVARQRRLGEVALQNGDYETAVASLGQVVKLGKYSWHRDSVDYTLLAKAHLGTDQPLEAAKVAMDLRREFKQDPQASLMAAVVDVVVCQHQGNNDRASELLGKALDQYAGFAEVLPENCALELAEACYRVGDQEHGSAIVGKLLKNNHEDPSLLEKVSAMYHMVGEDELGDQLVAQNAKRMIEINNAAVRMAQAGDFDGAVQRFIEAVEEMPGNTQILLNTVNAMLAFVSKRGWHDEYMALAQSYLDRVKALEPASVKYLKLREAFESGKKRFKTG